MAVGTIQQVGALRIPKYRFLYNVMILTGSTVLSRGILIAGIPLISRMFTPEAVGQWQLFVSLTTILGVIVTCRYEIAIVLPEDEAEAFDLLAICLGLSVAVSVVFFAVLAGFGDSILTAFGISELGATLVLLPLFTLLWGVDQAATYWFTRQERFSIQAWAKCARSVATILIPLGVACWYPGSVMHLVAGTLLGQLLSTSVFVAGLGSSIRSASVAAVSWASVKTTLLKYCSYPLYVAPYSFFGQLGKRIPFVAIMHYSTSHVVGLFAISQQLTFLPITFISASLNQAVFRRMAKGVQDESFKKFVLKVLTCLALLIAPWGALLGMHYETIVPWLLGSEWKEAADYATWMSLPAFLMLLTSWLDRVFDTLRRQRLAVALQLGSDLCSTGLFIGTLQAGYSPLVAVATYSLFLALYNAIWLVIVFRIAGFDLSGLSRLALICVSLFGGVLGIVCGLDAVLGPVSIWPAAAIVVLLQIVCINHYWRKR